MIKTRFKVFISHKYQGKEKNKKRVEEIINKLNKEYPLDTFISGIHCFSFLDSDSEENLDMCLRLLEDCDMLLVCDDYEGSDGVKKEMDFAKKNNISIFFL